MCCLLVEKAFIPEYGDERDQDFLNGEQNL